MCYGGQLIPDARADRMPRSARVVYAAPGKPRAAAARGSFFSQRDQIIAQQDMRVIREGSKRMISESGAEKRTKTRCA